MISRRRLWSTLTRRSRWMLDCPDCKAKGAATADRGVGLWYCFGCHKTGKL